MATLIANADGNLTGSSTFAAVETGANALKTIRNNSNGSLSSPASQASPTFTITNGSVIDGVVLWMFKGNGNTTGTVKVDLQKGGVSQVSVTVSKNDIPDNSAGAPQPVLFKFPSTVTGDGGSNWTIVLSTTGASETGLTYYRNSTTAGDFTRALRTTTAATPAAGDDLFILGELTGAGTHNARTVTMDSTAATVYGNGSVNSTSVAGGLLAVGNYGTLSYGNSAATNYILRVAGDVNVYQNGTLSIGASGAEIPRNSTAVLELQMSAASGDFGINILGGTLNAAGLSRTSGKNVVLAKLTANTDADNIIANTGASQRGTVVKGSASLFMNDECNSLGGFWFAEDATAGVHGAYYSGTSQAYNTTITASIWLAQGSGTNNRYVRVALGNSATFASITNGLYVDVDLQAGTVGTATAIGTGTATSASITAINGGYLITLTGNIASSGTGTPYLHMIACSAAGTTSYTGSNSQSFFYGYPKIVNAASVSGTTFNIDADTGWLAGDIVCVTAAVIKAGGETLPLSANAGASSFTTSIPAIQQHLGETLLYCHVGLLTRNVKIRSTSNSLLTYMYVTAGAVVNASWAEFAYMGTSTTTTKRGFAFDSGNLGATGAKTISYCSMHDFGYNILYNSGTSNLTSLNLDFGHNILYRTLNNDSIGITNTVATDWTIHDNLIAWVYSDGIDTSSLGTSINNNIVSGSGSSNSSYAFNIGGSIYDVTGKFDNNVCYASHFGLGVSASAPYGVIDNFSAWHNASSGVNYTSTGGFDLKFTNLTLLGNSSVVGQNISVGNYFYNLIIDGAVIAATTYQSSRTGRGFSNGASHSSPNFDFTNVDMSGVGASLLPHNTVDLDVNAISSTLSRPSGVFSNCKFGAPSLFPAKSSWSKYSYLSFQNFNQTTGDHRTEMTYGQLKTDSVIYNTASPSMRMTPSDASNKLESAPTRQGILVPVANGAAMIVSVYVRKSVSGDGEAYSGNQPRLIQRANPALGQNSDVVLATASGAAGSWEKLTGTTSTATNDGAWEIVVDCDGTAGWINVDDFDWSVA